LLPGLSLVVVFGSALGLLLSALNVYLRDVQHLVEVVLIALFWVSPIVYSYGFVTTCTWAGSASSTSPTP